MLAAAGLLKGKRATSHWSVVDHLALLGAIPTHERVVVDSNVVTGAGVVTALGHELADFWERLCAGKSGVGPLKRFATTDFKVTFGGEIRDFAPEEHLDIQDKEVRRLDRFA